MVLPRALLWPGPDHDIGWCDAPVPTRVDGHRGHAPRHEPLGGRPRDPTEGALDAIHCANQHTQPEAVMPRAPAYSHQNGASSGGEAGRRQGWSDPQNPYTTARLLIARHAETAGDYAAAEMAHAQGVGDAGDYDCWAEIYDAVAVLQAPPASRTSGP